MKLNWQTKRILKLWAPAATGIATMLLLASWSPAMSFVLFTHHLFWIVAGILLINPVATTLRPSSEVRLERGLAAQRLKKDRQQAETRKPAARVPPASTSETVTERLARLRDEKQAVEQRIERMTKAKGRVK